MRRRGEDYSMFRTLLLIMIGAGLAALGGCATANGVPRPRPFPSPDWKNPGATADNSGAPDAPGAPGAPLAPDAAPLASDEPLAPVPPLSRRYDARAVAEYALGFRGVPYRLGGDDPTGFDCSGLVRFVFAEYGVLVPRVVEDQYQVGEKVKPKDIKPGDLLFFSTKGAGPTHVAIAVGEDRFVHAPNSRGVVRVEALTSDYWGSHYIGARRITTPTTTNYPYSVRTE